MMWNPKAPSLAPPAPPSRADRSPVIWLICGCVALLAVHGVSFTADDMTSLYVGLMDNPGELTSRDGYRLEGLLNDVLGVTVFAMGWRDGDAVAVWSLISYALLFMSLAAGLANRSFSLYHLLLVCFFSHILDTLSGWVGKFDPLLLAFIALSLNQNRIASLAGGALSAFCHPAIALFSALGVFVSGDKAPFGRDAFLVVVVLCAAALDLLLFHLIFPKLGSRADFLGGNWVEVVANGLWYGVPNLLTAIYLPIRSLLFVTALDMGKRRKNLWLLIWLALVAVLTGFLTLDHTRVASLILFAPLLSYLGRHDHSGSLPSGQATKRWQAGLVFLVVARCFMPQL